MNIIKKRSSRNIVGILAALAMVTTVSACHTPAHRDGIAYIVAAGVIFAGGILLSSGLYNSYVGGHHGGHYASDSRLKTDVRHETTLKNGLKVYSYRYKGDERLFLGVMAQDLLNDDRFSHAVSKTASGYLMVDYGALGMPVANPEVLREASEAALARAS